MRASLKSRQVKSLILVISTFALSVQCFAAEPSTEQIVEKSPRYRQTEPRPHEFMESFRYVSIIYVSTLGAYLWISRDEVFHNASMQNYGRNLGNMTFFDQDLPSANWGTHFFTGAVAYEFYRGRSYGLVDAFFMTLIQECLFQFTVETLIQPTGLENVANTTIIGSLLGRGLELASLPLLNSDFWLFRGAGYVLNLPALFGLYEGKVQVMPVIESGKAGVALQYKF